LAQLALDHHEWHAFVGHLDRVRVAQLTWREPPADACGRRGASQVGACRRDGPWPAARWAIDDAERWPLLRGGRPT